MAGEMRGLDAGIYVGGTLVGAFRSVSLEVNGDVIDAGHAGNFGWRVKLVGQREWTMSSDVVAIEATGFEAGFEAARAAIFAGTTVAVIFETPDGQQFTGTAMVSSWSVEGEYEDVFQGSYELEGASELAFDATPA